MSKKGLLQTDMFYIDHLNTRSDADLRAIDEFHVDRPEGYGLEVYLKDFACDDEDDKTMHTYLVRYNKTDECAGYFSLKAGLISVNETVMLLKDEETGEEKEVREFDTLPGVEMANFAVNSTFVNKYKRLNGLGHIIFSEFVIPTVLKAAEHVGIKIIYIFSLPEEGLVNRYSKYGFQRMSADLEADFNKRLKPRYDGDCIFMYQLLD